MWLLSLCERLTKRQVQVWREYGRRDEEISCGNRNPTGYDGEFDTLGSELGTIDIEMQVKTLDLYLEQMEQKMEDMRTEQKERIRLYQCVGVTGGIFLAIILL